MRPPSIDRAPIPGLFPIIESALTRASAQSGPWLACRAGCCQCCVGVFAISQLDAETLCTGLALATPEVAAQIGRRVAASQIRLRPDFPGDPNTGLLFTRPEHRDAFEDFANHEPCPILDPAKGTCDLYQHRPVACRTFGPPIRDDDENFTVCELCFVDAPADEVTRCEMNQDWRPLEEELIAAAEERADLHGPTIVTFALPAPRETSS